MHEFLKRAKPRAVVIEAPHDHERQISVLVRGGWVRPVSLLAYTDTLPMKTLTFPLTDFSPEWNAMVYAFNTGTPIVFCDIPTGAAMYHALNVKSESAESYNDDTDLSDEMSAGDLATHQALMREKGSALRESLADDHILLREAFMRRYISEAEERYGDCAVIVGAMHLAGVEGVPYTDRDRVMTENAPTFPAKLTVMPDSFERISGLCGYGKWSRDPVLAALIFRDLCRGRTPKSDHTAEEGAAFTDRRGTLPPGVVCTSLCGDLRNRLEALRLGELIRKGSLDLTLDVNEYNITDGRRSGLLHGLLSLEVDIGSVSAEQMQGFVRESWHLRMPTDTELNAAAQYGCTIERAVRAKQKA